MPNKIEANTEKPDAKTKSDTNRHASEAAHKAAPRQRQDHEQQTACVNCVD